MSNPTIEVIAQIDRRIIINRVKEEWERESKLALQAIADRIGKKYFHEIGFYESDGLYEVSPTMELQQLQNKVAERRRRMDDK